MHSPRSAVVALVAIALATVATPGIAKPGPTKPDGPRPNAVTAWPGGSTVLEVDTENAFGQNLSGLAFERGKGPAVMWAVQNDPSKLYKLVDDGTNWVPQPGAWGAGKTLVLPGGSTSRPDSEGVTFTDLGSAGGIFVSSERNLAASTVSKNEIVRYDVNAVGPTLRSTGAWDLTADLPAVGSNLGIEAITWVPDSTLVADGLTDQSTNQPYDPALYPNHGRGLFFVGLEGGGGVYGYALDLAGSGFTRITSVASSLSGVMDLAFDTETEHLWAVCDNTCIGQSAILDIVGGVFTVTTVHNRPSAMPNKNNEGFTITPRSECFGGVKPVFWAEDGPSPHVLREGTATCSTPDHPPAVSALSVTPTTLPQAGGPVTITAVATDDLAVTQVYAEVRRAGAGRGPATQVPLAAVGGNVYQGTWAGPANPTVTVARHDIRVLAVDGAAQTAATPVRTVSTTSRALTAAPTTLAFGPVAVGATSSLATTLANRTSGPVNVSLSIPSGSGFVFATTQSRTAVVTVPADGSVDVAVTFAPKALGARSGQVSAAPELSDQLPVMVSVTGTGV